MEVRAGTLNLGAKNTKGEINSSQLFLLIGGCLIVWLLLCVLMGYYYLTVKKHHEAIVVCIWHYINHTDLNWTDVVKEDM